jgi:hypothetical protein
MGAHIIRVGRGITSAKRLSRHMQASVDRLQYQFDYSRWLADGETISTFAFAVEDTTTPPLVVSGTSVDSATHSLLTCFIGGGVSGTKYSITVQITTSAGQTLECYIDIKVKDPAQTVTGNVQATPSLVDQIAAQVAEFNATATDGEAAVNTAIANAEATLNTAVTNAASSASAAATSATGAGASAASAATSLATLLGSLVLSFTRLAKTGAYTLLNGDKGKTIALGGNALFTLTINAASGYDANYAAMITNEDNIATGGRAKWISGPGLNFRLWPGQSCILYNNNNVWFTLGAPRRLILPNGTNWTFHFDPALGSDIDGASDGLATGAGAFKTADHVFHIIDREIDGNSGQVTILNAPGGVDTAGCHLPYWGFTGLQGGAGITLDLNGGTLSGAGAPAIDAYFTFQVSVRNGTLGDGTGGAISASRGAIVQVEDGVTFAACAAGYSHIIASDESTVLLFNNYSISGGGSSHMVTSRGGYINAAGVTATFIGAANSIAFTNDVVNSQGVVYAPSAWANAAAVNAGTTQAYSESGGSGQIVGASSIPGSAGANANFAGDVTIDPLGNTRVALSKVSNFLAAPVALNNTATWFDGPSMAQGTVGTWWVSGQVSVKSTDAGWTTVRCKLWDGTTVIADGEVSYLSGTMELATLTLSGWITNPAANIRISCRDTVGTNGTISADSIAAGGKDSSIYGIRVG